MNWKPAGLLDSRRGVQGGYYLTTDPKDITVRRIFRLIDGPLDPVRCTGDKESTSCPLIDKCSLIQLWNQAKEALESVYDSVNFHGACGPRTNSRPKIRLRLLHLTDLK